MAELSENPWAGTRWANEPHIRFGDPCHDCGVEMTPASRWWCAFTIPAGMRKHAGLGLCGPCARRRRELNDSDASTAPAAAHPLG